MPLDPDELETILIIARNGQSGRITEYEVKQLVEAYCALYNITTDVYYPETREERLCRPLLETDGYFADREPRNDDNPLKPLNYAHITSATTSEELIAIIAERVCGPVEPYINARGETNVEANGRMRAEDEISLTYADLYNQD